MMSEFVSASDDILERLQNIHGMFDSPKSIKDDKPTLTKQEKLDPAESLIDKLKMYEKCDGSVEEQQIEKQRKEYFEGLKFNTLQTALQLFKNSSELRQAKEVELKASTLVPTNVVSKGTIDDIRSVFVNAIASTDKDLDNIDFSDQQWFSNSNEDRIRKLLTLSSPYLRSYQEMTDDIVLECVRNEFINVSRKICESSTEPSTDISDRQWFYGITEERVEKLIEITMEKSKSNQKLNADMWCKIRAALLNCVESTAALFNRQSKMKSEKDSSLQQQKGNLTASRIEKILAESGKEFRKVNKELDLKIVDGITNELKNRIQAAIIDQQRVGEDRKLLEESDEPVPAKLTADRLNKIFSDFKKQTKKTVDIDPAQFEGLTSNIKEKMLEEMNKTPTLSKTVIDIQSGLAGIAKQKLLEDMSDKQTMQLKEAQEIPKAIHPDKIDRFIKPLEESQPVEWVPDVDVQRGIAKERMEAFSTGVLAKQKGNVEWSPDVPITSGIARERASLLFDSGSASSGTPAWTPDVELESGLAKDRAAQLLAATSEYSNYVGKQWQPDVLLERGSVGQKVESFVNTLPEFEHQWKPDIELPSGITKQCIQSLFEGKTSFDELDAKDANELIHAGLTKERLSEFLNIKDTKLSKESWEPDVELQKGITKERTSLFHNLENLQQTKQQASTIQEELNQLNQPNGKRVVVEVENEPLPSDPNIARGDFRTEQANIEAGYTKSMIERLKNAYEADTEVTATDNENIKQEISINAGHAQNLLRKFTDFETDAKTIHTTAEKQTTIPRRFVSKPAPVTMEYETVTEEKCLCCRGPVFSTEGVFYQDLGYLHKRCMKCPTCNKIPPSTEAVFRDNHIYCIEHESK